MDGRRGEKILRHLGREGLVAHRHISEPAPVRLDALLRVHDAAYLESLQDAAELDRVLPGLLDAVPDRQVLAWQRRMAGGTVAAGRRAIETGRPAVTLGGGMHHASEARGEGFCLFNDVATSIADLRARGFTGRILVVDLDLHPGNGTRSIFAADPSVFTFSVHATEWGTTDAVADRSVELGAGVGDATYLAALDELLPDVFAAADPALVYYVAGTDIAEDDRLGNWHITTDGIAARDRRVVEAAGDLPFVWTLAGGYGPDAWRHTARSLVWLLTGRDEPIASGVERELERYRGIARSLPAWRLTSGDEEPLDLSDVLADLGPKRASARFLDYYTEFGLELALEAYGVLEHIRGRGYEGPFGVYVDPGHATGHLARLHSARDELLIELVLRPHYRDGLNLLFVEWLTLQDPRRAPTRPLLPGQSHPGLGCLPLVTGMLVMACERLDYDGLAFHPAHYHVAAVARGVARFLEPGDEACFDAMRGLLEGHTLAEATALVASGRLLTAAGEPMKWNPAPMVAPASSALRDRLDGPARQAAVEAARAGCALAGIAAE
jgi:acetoin utilization deacetylase AcuC-like enzyme